MNTIGSGNLTFCIGCAKSTIIYIAGAVIANLHAQFHIVLSNGRPQPHEYGS